MLVLALDTTTRAGSVALARDGAVVDVFVGDASRTHATRLPGDLLEVLKRHGLSLGDVDVFAVAAGPGSFTGLRIGIATIQGLAFANQRPVVAVSALDALAYAAWMGETSARRNPEAGGHATQDAGGHGLRPGSDQRRPSLLIGAWMDAQRHEVYTALYEPLPQGGPLEAPGEAGSPATFAADLGELRVLEAAAVGEPAVTIERWRPRLGADTALRTSLVGDGALAYRARAEDAFPGIRVLDTVPDLAPVIAIVAGRRAQLGLAVAPHAVKPVYVRRPDAELARDRGRQPSVGSGGAGPAGPTPVAGPSSNNGSSHA